MLVVNIFGGPCCGKSTTSAGVFSQLKKRNYNVELVTEYAKDMVWEKRQAVFDNQIYIFGKQHHRLWRLKDQVEVAITDSPLLLSLIYNIDKSEIGKSLNDLVLNTYKSFNNLNFFLNRIGEYNTIGRNQTENEAKEIDNEIKRVLDTHEIVYTELVGHTDYISQITEIVAIETNMRMKHEGMEFITE